MTDHSKTTAPDDDPLSLHYGSSQPGEGVLLTPAQRAAAGPQAEPQTVRMDVLRDGSFAGTSHHAGDSIDVPAEYVETLGLSGFAVRADRVERAQKARESGQARTDALTKRRGARSTAVAPMTTQDVAVTEPAPGADTPHQE